MKQALYYIVVVAILATGLLVFFGLPQEQVSRRLMVGVITAVTYGLWGILHHVLDHTVNRKIVVEYVALSAFASALLWAFLII